MTQSTLNDKKYQLNPPNIRYATAANGNVRNGNENERQRYPDAEFPSRQEINAIATDVSSRIMKGTTI